MIDYIEWSRIMITGSTSDMLNPFLWDYTNDNNDFLYIFQNIFIFNKVGI